MKERNKMETKIVEEIIKKEVYVASDGREFISKQKCIYHEQSICVHDYDIISSEEEVKEHRVKVGESGYSGWVMEPIYETTREHYNVVKKVCKLCGKHEFEQNYLYTE
jgi:hypothetical protein